MSDNYVLGRGELYFAKYKPGTTIPGAEIYFGNTPSFSITSNVQKLEHYNSDRGVKEKDLSIDLQTDRSASITCDNMSADNIALMFMGTSATITTTAATAVTETFTGVTLGGWYQLGVSAAAPTGVRKVTNVVVKKGATALTLHTDYEVEPNFARVQIVGGALANGDDIEVTYDVQAHTNWQVISGNSSTEGALRFISFNPAGKQIDYFFPYVKIAPDGDMNLKGDDWQMVTFTVDILKKTGLQAIYSTSRPS